MPSTENTNGYVTKDSGQRQEFESGSVRDLRSGKGRYDLISPIAVRRLAGVYERGAEKYAARNWEKGQPLSRYVDSALRHTFQYLEGFRDEDHLGQAFWNLAAAIHTEEMINRGRLPESLNDLPDMMPQENAVVPNVREEIERVAKSIDLSRGYCLKCKKQVDLQDPLPYKMKTGRYATKGNCPDCGTGIFRIGNQIAGKERGKA